MSNNQILKLKEGDKLCAKGYRLWAEGANLRAEGDKLYYAKGYKLWIEGHKLRNKGYKPLTENNKQDMEVNIDNQ